MLSRSRQFTKVATDNRFCPNGDWKAIAAVAWPSLGLGFKNKLPWDIAADMKYFKETTLSTPAPDMKNVVVMGRKTWDSIPSINRPLSDRVNIILTHKTEQNMDFIKSNTFFANSLPHAREIVIGLSNIHSTFIMGGESIYRSALDMNYVSELLLTRIHMSNNKTRYDTFFPNIDSEWICTERLDEGIDRASGIKHEFVRYTKREGSK